MNRLLPVLGCVSVFLFLIGNLESAELSEYDEKVISLFQEFGFLNEPPSFPKDHVYWEKLAWYKDQGEQIQPALQHLFTNGFKNEPAKRATVLNALSTSPGDKSKLLQLVRDEVGDLELHKGQFGYHGLLKSFLSFMGTHGSNEDLEIIDPFLEHDDVLIRSTARNQIAKLEKRIQSQHSERYSKSTGVEDNKNRGNETIRADTDDSKKPNSAQWLYWILGALILGGVGVLIWNSRKGASAR